MIGFLRCVGLLNAAIWFGAAIFFTFAAAPAAFSQDMRDLLGQQYYPYFSGAIAQILIARYFRLQMVCGVVALLHLAGERLYFGKSADKLRLGLLSGLVVISLAGSLWLQPMLKQLHHTKYALGTAPGDREPASQSFRAWHGASQAANLLMLAGLGVYLWRVANSAEPARFVSSAKFRS